MEMKLEKLEICRGLKLAIKLACLWNLALTLCLIAFIGIVWLLGHSDVLIFVVAFVSYCCIVGLCNSGFYFHFHRAGHSLHLKPSSPIGAHVPAAPPTPVGCAIEGAVTLRAPNPIPEREPLYDWACQVALVSRMVSHGCQDENQKADPVVDRTALTKPLLAAGLEQTWGAPQCDEDFNNDLEACTCHRWMGEFEVVTSVEEQSACDRVPSGSTSNSDADSEISDGCFVSQKRLGEQPHTHLSDWDANADEADDLPIKIFSMKWSESLKQDRVEKVVPALNDVRVRLAASLDYALNADQLRDAVAEVVCEQEMLSLRSRLTTSLDQALASGELARMITHVAEPALPAAEPRRQEGLSLQSRFRTAFDEALASGELAHMIASAAEPAQSSAKLRCQDAADLRLRIGRALDGVLASGNFGELLKGQLTYEATCQKDAADLRLRIGRALDGVLASGSLGELLKGQLTSEVAESQAFQEIVKSSTSFPSVKDIRAKFAERRKDIASRAPPRRSFSGPVVRSQRVSIAFPDMAPSAIDFMATPRMAESRTSLLLSRDSEASSSSSRRSSKSKPVPGSRTGDTSKSLPSHDVRGTSPRRSLEPCAGGKALDINTAPINCLPPSMKEPLPAGSLLPPMPQSLVNAASRNVDKAEDERQNSKSSSGTADTEETEIGRAKSVLLTVKNHLQQGMLSLESQDEDQIETHDACAENQPGVQSRTSDVHQQCEEFIATSIQGVAATADAWCMPEATSNSVQNTPLSWTMNRSDAIVKNMIQPSANEIDSVERTYQLRFPRFGSTTGKIGMMLSYPAANEPQTNPRICDLKPGALADEFGICIGDDLIAINGKPTAGQSKASIREQLQNVPFALELHRHLLSSVSACQSQMELAMTIETGVGHGLGFDFSKPYSYPVITTVADGSDAWIKGILPQDVLVSIGGQCTAAMQLEDLQQALYTEAVKVRVWRFPLSQPNCS